MKIPRMAGYAKGRPERIPPSAPPASEIPASSYRGTLSAPKA